MADEERLVVALEARIRDFERNLARANQTANRQFGAIERRAQLTGRRMERTMGAIGGRIGSMARGWGAGILAGFTVREAQQLVDSATRIRNSLKNAGLEGEELQKVYDALFESAQRNAAPLGALADLYGKLAINQKELGVSQQELIGFTDRVALALRVAGTDAQSASGSLLQLSQALGGGVVRAEEFNSIVEGTPTIARAAAAGLKEAGGSVAQLRQLVIDGQVSSEAFFRAFMAGSVTLQQQAANSQITISQSFVRLGNSLVHIAGEFDKATGASRNFADGVTYLADAISSFDVSGFVGDLDAAVGAVERFLNGIGNAQIFKDINEALGVTQGGLPVNLEAEAAKAEAAALEREVEQLQATIEKNSELGFDNTEALARLDEVMARLAQVRAAMADMPTTLPAISVSGGDGAATLINEQVPFNPLAPITTAAKPVSLADYPLAASGGAGGGRRSGGGGGSGGENAYQREVADIQRHIAMLQAETDARRNATGSIEEQERAVEQARVRQELLTAAQQAGLAVTPALEGQIDQLARSYADAGFEAQALADRQQEAQQQAQEWASFGGSLVSGFIADLRQGKTASEAFANALGKITDKLIDMLVQMLIVKPLMGLFGFSSGGLVEGDAWAGLRLARGGHVRGPGTSTSDSIPARLSDGEFVVNAKQTAKHRALLEAINSGAVLSFAAGGIVGDGSNIARLLRPANDNAGAVNVTTNVTVNAAGGTPEQNADLAKQVGKQIEQTVRGVVADEMRKATRPGNFANRRGA